MEKFYAWYMAIIRIWGIMQRICGESNESQTNLVPFGRLYFMTISLAPITTPKKMETAKIDLQQITEACFNPQNFLVKTVDFDAEEDKYMAISLNHRSDAKQKEKKEKLKQLVDEDQFQHH